MREPIKFHWKAIHHLYIGMCILMLACLIVLNEQYPIWGSNFLLLGIYIVFDDIVEHTITANTPIRLLSEKILEPTLKKASYYFKKSF